MLGTSFWRTFLTGRVERPAGWVVHRMVGEAKRTSNLVPARGCCWERMKNFLLVLFPAIPPYVPMLSFSTDCALLSKAYVLFCSWGWGWGDWRHRHTMHMVMRFNQTLCA